MKISVPKALFGVYLIPRSIKKDFYFVLAKSTIKNSINENVRCLMKLTMKSRVKHSGKLSGNLSRQFVKNDCRLRKDNFFLQLIVEFVPMKENDRHLLSILKDNILKLYLRFQKEEISCQRLCWVVLWLNSLIRYKVKF